jgi:hypothetical protein
MIRILWCAAASRRFKMHLARLNRLKVPCDQGLLT